MKPKFSVSIDEELCEWLDSKIRDRTFSSRSHGIEKALYNMMKESS